MKPMIRNIAVAGVALGAFGILAVQATPTKPSRVSRAIIEDFAMSSVKEASAFNFADVHENLEDNVALFGTAAGRNAYILELKSSKVLDDVVQKRLIIEAEDVRVTSFVQDGDLALIKGEFVLSKQGSRDRVEEPRSFVAEVDASNLKRLELDRMHFVERS